MSGELESDASKAMAECEARALTGRVELGHGGTLLFSNHCKRECLTALRNQLIEFANDNYDRPSPEAQHGFKALADFLEVLDGEIKKLG